MQLITRVVMTWVPKKLMLGSLSVQRIRLSGIKLLKYCQKIVRRNRNTLSSFIKEDSFTISWVIFIEHCGTFQLLLKYQKRKEKKVQRWHYITIMLVSSSMNQASWKMLWSITKQRQNCILRTVASGIIWDCASHAWVGLRMLFKIMIVL